VIASKESITGKYLGEYVKEYGLEE
jgi:hypothetical protein